MAVVPVTLRVGAYPQDNAIGIQAEASPDGLVDWVEILDTDVIGTYPFYTTSYPTTVDESLLWFRMRWQLVGTNVFTEWSEISSFLQSPTVPILTEQMLRMSEALIQKATRIYVLSQAPMGYTGDLVDEMVASVRPDYQIQELLYGLRFRNWAVNLAALATVDDVIRHGLQADPADFPVEKIPDVQRALSGAVSWVAEFVMGGIGVS